MNPCTVRSDQSQSIQSEVEPHAVPSNSILERCIQRLCDQESCSSSNSEPLCGSGVRSSADSERHCGSGARSSADSECPCGSEAPSGSTLEHPAQHLREPPCSSRAVNAGVFEPATAGNLESSKARYPLREAAELEREH